MVWHATLRSWVMKKGARWWKKYLGNYKLNITGISMEAIKRYMEKLVLQFITDRFGDYKTYVENGHLVVYNDDMYVVGALIYARKQFNYMQHIQIAIMGMFDLTIEEVDWYMKKWVLDKFNEEVLGTDGVFGH